MNASQAPRTQVSVLVTGGGNPWNRIAVRAARMVGLTLAEHGLGLVTGNSTGVDKAVAVAFCNELKRRKEPCEERFIQLRMRWWRRGGFWPGRAFRAPEGTNSEVGSEDDWLEEARTSAAAAVILGGRAGTLRIANHFIDAGKPVLPVPFTGGTSSEVFQEVLRNWCDNPVVGLERSQFLRLAVPWVGGTGALADLLMGTLSSKAAIFLSYRRADSEWVAGRLRQDLVEHFGKKRVFQDQEHIGPADMWDTSIDEALRDCRIGIVVVGPRWLDRPEGTQRARIEEDDDVLRREIKALIQKNKRIVVLMTPGAPPPPWELPGDIAEFNRCQALRIAPDTWRQVVDEVVQTIRPLLRPEARTFPPPQA